MLVGGATLPHPPIILPASAGRRGAEARATTDAVRTASDWIGRLATWRRATPWTVRTGSATVAAMDGKPPSTVSQGLLFSSAQEAVLDALGDRTRRLILQRLRQGPLPVVEIARGLPVSRPAVSQHLKVLKRAGLVVDRPQGNRRIYAVNPDALSALRGFLDAYWQEALSRFAEMAERSS